MNILKMIILIIGMLTGLSTSFASSSGGAIHVEIENEGQSLARGYAQAFDSLPTGAKYAIIKTEKGANYLTGSIRDIKAIEAVLVIYMDAGPIHVINAHDVVKLTNLRPIELP